METLSAYLQLNQEEKVSKSKESISRLFHRIPLGYLNAVLHRAGRPGLGQKPSHPTENPHNFPRFKNLFGRSTCLDLKNSATFLPKKS